MNCIYTYIHVYAFLTFLLFNTVKKRDLSLNFVISGQTIAAISHVEGNEKSKTVHLYNTTTTEKHS